MRLCAEISTHAITHTVHSSALEVHSSALGLSSTWVNNIVEVMGIFQNCKYYAVKRLHHGLRFGFGKIDLRATCLCAEISTRAKCTGVHFKCTRVHSSALECTPVHLVHFKCTGVH